MVFALAAAVGCGGTDGYDSALRYPLRADPLVLSPPPTVPVAPPAPGLFDEAIARFPASGGRIADPAGLAEPDRAELWAALDLGFGTPSAPTIVVPGGGGSLADLDLSADALAAGSVLYKRHCVHCHGLTGNGRGPTGPFIYPYPRDFRQGLFKAVANPAGQGKPMVADLERVIRRGVPGSSMQAFTLLSDEDVSRLAGYVVHLSLRGEAEFAVARGLLDETGDDWVDDVARTCDESNGRAWGRWQTAQEPAAVTLLPDEDGAIGRGYELFTAGAGAGCLKCHEDFGRADVYRYDVWGGVNRVRDLTLGEYRWGGEPETLARRVRHGIPAAGMPANPGLTDEQVRDLVAFVRAVPFPPQLPAEVRAAVYPGSP